MKQDTHCNGVKECFSPSKVKKWAIDDLQSTISWLESQDEKVNLFWLDICNHLIYFVFAARYHLYVLEIDVIKFDSLSIQF